MASDADIASGEIELISDDDGLAVIGDPVAVERFLAAEGLSSKDLGLSRLKKALGAGGVAAQAGSEIAANAGRWVKLTEGSAQKLKAYNLMTGSSPGVKRAVLVDGGRSKGFLEIVKTPGTFASNPAVLAGVGGLMTQLALQQTMDEISNYLETIDKKLDRVLRSQLNQVLARMDAVDLIIREAMIVRETVGRVSEVTWSKVQSTSATVIETQAYALRQLSDLVVELEQKTDVGDLAGAAREAESEVQKWLAVLARCVQLHDAVAVLELDRVLDTDPGDLDRHRMGLKIARENRVELLKSGTNNLLARMNASVVLANSKVLLHPNASPALAGSSNRVAADINDFRVTIGIGAGQQRLEAKHWGLAAAEARDKAFDAGSDVGDAALRLGNETYDRAKVVGSKVGKASDQIVRHVPRWFRDDKKPSGEPE